MSLHSFASHVTPTIKPPRGLARAIIAALSLLGGVASAQEDWGPYRSIKAGAPGEFRQADGVRLYDCDGDNDADIVVPFEKSNKVYVLANPGVTTGEWPVKWTIDLTRCGAPEDALMTDLDGDGTLEVVASCEGGHVTVTRMVRPFEVWSFRGRARNFPKKIKWVYAVAADLDGDGDVDLVIGSKNSAGNVKKLGWLMNPGDPITSAQALAGWTYFDIATPKTQVMSIIVVDMEATDGDGGDGDLDVVMTDRYNLVWYENNINDKEAKNRYSNWTEGGTIFSGGMTMFAHLADVDGDGKKDFVFAVKQGAHRGVHFARQEVDPDGAMTWDLTHIPVPVGPEWNGAGPKAAGAYDLSEAAYLDIVVTFVAANGKHGAARICYDEGEAEWTWRPIASNKGGQGIKFDNITMLDLNGDGDLDLISTEEAEGPNNPGPGLGVVWFQNPGRARLEFEQ